MPVLLALNNVVAHIQGTQVLRNVSLTVNKGETVALIGRNGAGKTSLIRTVMGVLPLTSGQIYFDRQDLGKASGHMRPVLGVGYAPEERRLIGKFTVLDNILLPAWACGLSQAQINERLKLVYYIAPELEEMSERLGGLLSGGQQKMVALARALMAGQKLVILDEPFQGLAPALAHSYAERLRLLREQKPELAILIAESNPSLLESMVDHLITIERGEAQKQS